jgi:hypothetical protein
MNPTAQRGPDTEIRLTTSGQRSGYEEQTIQHFTIEWIFEFETCTMSSDICVKDFLRHCGSLLPVSRFDKTICENFLFITRMDTTGYRSQLFHGQWVDEMMANKQIFDD